MKTTILLPALTSTLMAATASLPAPAQANEDPAAQWGHWRGPTGNGTSETAKPPTEWSGTENVRWKVAVPGAGSASPVVWGDRVFVSTAIATGKGADGVPIARGGGDAPDAGRRPSRRPGGGGGGGGGGGEPTEVHQFVLLCFDRATGKERWRRIAAETVPAEGHHPDHGFASASPFTDGEHVFAHFGSRGLFAFTMEGEPVWSYKDFEPMTTRSGFGEGSSPTIHGGTIIVPWDHEGDSYLLALDKKSGKALWKTERDEPSNWGTPLVVSHAGGKQVVHTGENFARGYDLETGREIWRCAGQTSRPVASPVAADGIVFVGSGFRGSFLGAFRLGATGDLEGTDAVLWSTGANTPDIASLLLANGRIYYLSGKSANVTCRDAKTGEVHYEDERLEGMGTVYASPVAADGRVYITARNGRTVVLKDGETLEVLAENDLGEGIDATPALVGGEIFIRGTGHLYCIGEE